MRARCVHNKYIAHNTYHGAYNVPSKFGEDPFRNVDTYSRTDGHTDRQADRQTDRHTHINSPIYNNIYTILNFLLLEGTRGDG
jgi:hypothetical protein